MSDRLAALRASCTNPDSALIPAPLFYGVNPLCSFAVLSLVTYLLVRSLPFGF